MPTKAESRTRDRNLFRYEAVPVDDPSAEPVTWPRVQAGDIGALIYIGAQHREVPTLENTLAVALFSAIATGASAALGVGSPRPGDADAVEAAIIDLATRHSVRLVPLWDDGTPLTAEEDVEWNLRQRDLAERVARRVVAEGIAAEGAEGKGGDPT